ncbi:Bro-N domain-containing protein [Scytonema sp. NUACC26]|uniref:BRO-N domain-containing protein n=1 Tax=Scytonema sp. NUACC26 TaxID=3140176 RepID=UPI0034DB8406
MTDTSVLNILLNDLDVLRVDVDGKTYYWKSEIEKMLGYKEKAAHVVKQLQKTNCIYIKTQFYPDLKYLYDKCIFRITLIDEEGVLLLIWNSEMEGARKLRNVMTEKILLQCVQGAFLFLQTKNNRCY